MKTLVAVLFAALASGTTEPQVRGGPALEGVWQVAEISRTSGVISRPQPGLYIFTRSHYSVVQVVSESPRPPLPVDITAASQPDLIAVLGPSFQAQSGRYRRAGDDLVLQAVVSKNPALMQGGAESHYSTRMEGAILILTSRDTANITYKLSRVE